MIANIHLVLAAGIGLPCLLLTTLETGTIIKPIWYVRRLNIVRFTPLHELMKPVSEELEFELRPVDSTAFLMLQFPK